MPKMSLAEESQSYPLKLDEVDARKAMIISVGGSPEPIVTSLLKHLPDFVCFFATQRSMDLIGGIKEKTKEQAVAFDDCKVIADDENDLVYC